MSNTNPTEQKLEAFLHGRYEASKSYQESAGRQFDITWNEYLNLWSNKRYQLNRLKQQIIRGTARAFTNSDDGYVLTWKNKAAFMDGVINVHTMEIKTRRMSKRVCHMTAGDTHRPESIEKIRKARVGTKHRVSTKKAISTSLKGLVRSEETKSKMSAAATQRWARERAERNGEIM